MPACPHRRAVAVLVAIVAAGALISACSSSAPAHPSRTGGASSSPTHPASPSSGSSTSSSRRPTETAAPSATGRSGSSGITDVTGHSYHLKYSVSLDALRRYAPHATLSVRIVHYDGLRRAYLVAVAKSVRADGPKLPLLTVLHGWYASADLEAERTEFLPYVEQGKAIAIYPVGYDESWNIAGEDCCHAAVARHLDDAGFVAAATRDAMSWLPVDRSRSYLVGYSNGGKLAFDVACGQSAPYAAFATMAAMPLRTCTSDTRPLSALVAVGAADTELAKQGAGRSPTAQLATTAAALRARDRCASGTSTTHVGVATLTDSRGCTAGTAVRTVAYAGLGHLWPRSAPLHGPAAQVAATVALARLIWGFFAAHGSH